MRPQLNAGDNNTSQDNGHEHYAASMRPQLNAGDNMNDQSDDGLDYDPLQ